MTPARLARAVAIVLALALGLALEPLPAPAQEHMPPERPAGDRGEVPGAHGEKEHAGGEAHGGHYHDIDLGAIGVQALGFAILFGILAYFAFPFVGDKLNARRRQIADTFDDLERRIDVAKKGKLDAETKLKEAERGSLARMEQAMKEGVRLRDQLLAEADEQAAKIAHKAKVEGAIERAKMLIELRNQVVEVGFAAAEAAIRETMDRETQKRLVERFLDDLEALSSKGASASTGMTTTPKGGA